MDVLRHGAMKDAFIGMRALSMLVLFLRSFTWATAALRSPWSTSKWATAGLGRPHHLWHDAPAFGRDEWSGRDDHVRYSRRRPVEDKSADPCQGTGP